MSGARGGARLADRGEAAPLSRAGPQPVSSARRCPLCPRLRSVEPARAAVARPVDRLRSPERRPSPGRFGGARAPATRLVQIGRPRADLDGFDLVVTTPQYRLPERPNVLHLALPLHSVDPRGAGARRGGVGAAIRAASRVRASRSSSAAAPSLSCSMSPAARRLAERGERARPRRGRLAPAQHEPADARGVRAGDLRLARRARLRSSLDARGRPQSLSRLSRARRRIRGDRRQRVDAGRRVQHRPARLVRRAADASFASVPCARTCFGADCWRPSGPQSGRAWDSRALASQSRRAAGCAIRAISGRLHAALVASGRALPLGRTFTAPPPPPVDEIERVVGSRRGALLILNLERFR